MDFTGPIVSLVLTGCLGLQATGQTVSKEVVTSWVQAEWARADHVLTIPGRRFQYTKLKYSELTEAEIRMERDHFDERLDYTRRFVPGPTRIFFTVQMPRYTAVFGPTYRAALATLFETWDADEQRRENPLALGPES